MAHDPESTSIFHKYLLADNTVGLCYAQVTPIPDPTPLDRVRFYMRCWHFSEGPEGPSGQPCLWRAVSLKKRRSEKQWEEGPEKKQKGR